jgi:hypothetical protein
VVTGHNLRHTGPKRNAVQVDLLVTQQLNDVADIGCHGGGRILRQADALAGQAVPAGFDGRPISGSPVFEIRFLAQLQVKLVEQLRAIEGRGGLAEAAPIEDQHLSLVQQRANKTFEISGCPFNGAGARPTVQINERVR